MKFPRVVIYTMSLIAISAYLLAISFWTQAIGGDENARPTSGGTSYSWASGRMDEAYWGLAVGDVDGDDVSDVILIERQQVLIGDFEGSGFKRRTSCTWPGNAQVARVYAFDLDADHDDEIILSAVNYGMPSSIALDFEEGECRVLFSDVHWSLRVLDSHGGKKALVGQSWSSQDYFTGPILGMSFADGKLRSGERLNLPDRTAIYQFALGLGDEGGESVLLQKTNAPMEIKERRGRRFKRVWRSAERFGGSANLLVATSREVLGSVDSETVSFEVSPMFVEGVPGMSLFAVHQGMPLKSFIGRHPYIRDSQVVGFRKDVALGLVEVYRTVGLPGAVVDYAIDNKGKDGSKRLLVLVLEGGGFFTKGTSSIVLAFDLPSAGTPPAGGKH